MSFADSCKRLEGGQDGQLSRYITDTEAIKALKDYKNPAVVAVGLKGIGKSSAYRALTEFGKFENEVVIGIDPNKFALHLPKKDLSYTSFRKQFEHELVVEALRSIVERAFVLEANVSGIKTLIAEAKRHQQSYVEAVKNFLGRGGGISFAGFGFSVGKADSPVLVGLRPQEDIQAAQETLRALCRKGVKVRVVVDDPEQVFSASASLDVNLVGGFCLAAITLSHDVENLKIIALMKPHVYQPVMRSVDDLTRYPYHMIRLRWTHEELIKIIQRRLDAEGQKWTDVFEGTEASAKKMLRDELEKITRNGPRDLLRSLDAALESSTNGKASKVLLQTSRERAAQGSLDELTSAYNALYPDLGDVVSAIFRNSAEKSFTLEELRNHIQTLQMKDPDMKAVSKLKWMQAQNTKTLPNLLLETGVIAFRHANKTILPFEEQYSLDRFRKADAVFLVPALAAAVAP
jgi:hypothetical protein